MGRQFEPERVEGQIIARVDTRWSSLLIASILVVVAAGIWIYTLVADDHLLIPIAVSALAAVLLVAFLGYGWKLLLTTEGVYYLKRTRLFGPWIVLASIPLGQLGTVRHWYDSRRSDAGSARFTVRVIQVRDRRGKGFRVTGQLIPGSQLEGLRRALAARGCTMEFLQQRPAS